MRAHKYLWSNEPIAFLYIYLTKFPRKYTFFLWIKYMRAALVLGICKLRVCATSAAFFFALEIFIRVH